MGKFYKWFVVGMLWCICVLNYADRQAIFAVFPKLEAEFGFTKVQLGLIGSAFMWVYAAGAPFAGMAGDFLRRKDLILGGCFFWSIVTAMTGQCAKLWQFTAVRALEGLGETFYFPASMSMISDYHDPKTRSRAMSFHQSSVYVGTILGSWVAALLAEKFNWRLGFYLFGSAGVVLVIVLYAFLKEPVREQKGQLKGESSTFTLAFASIFKKPAALLLMIAFMGANFVATIFMTWTPTFLVEKFHFRLSAAGLSGTVFIYAASAFAVPVAGWLADVLAGKYKGARILVQFAGLIGGVGFIYTVGLTNNATTLLVAMVGFGICKGFYDSNIFASIFDVVDPKVKASAAGVMNTVGWGGGALGPVAVGWFTAHGGAATPMANMSKALAFCSLIYLGSALLLLAAVFALSGDLKRTDRFPENNL